VFSKNVLFKNILSNVARQQGSTTKYFSVHYGRNVGSAAGTETVTLPTAGNQQYEQASISMKYQFHTIAITDVAMQASKRSPEFLVNVLESEYAGAKEDMQRQLSRQGYADGTGIVCRVNDASPDTTLTFDTPMVGKYPTDYFEANATSTAGGPVLFASDTSGVTSTAFTTVTYITGNYTMTVASSSGIADDDYVFLAIANGTATPTVGRNGTVEMMGLKGLIDDNSNVTTLEGLSRDTYIWWKSYVSSADTQRSLTEALMHTTFLEAKKKGNPKYALTSFDLFSAYGQLLASDRRYTSTMTLDGGFTGVNFNEIALVADYDAPYDEMYFVDPSVISIEDLAPMSFMNEDGSILDRSATTPTWNATLRYYANLAIKAPNKCAALRDVIA
jgi:hypothetical protein